MKVKRIPLIASITISIAMFLVALFIEYCRNYLNLGWELWIFIIIAIILVQVINYLILHRLFEIFSKRQLKKISKFLPQHFFKRPDSLSSLNLMEVGEKVSRITQRQNSQLISMKELESYRKEYVGNVAHELKTPLFAIQGYADTLLEGASEDPEILEKYLFRITKSVDRLLTVVSDLDMINKFEAGEIVLHQENFDINQVVKEVFEVLEGEAQQTNAQLILDSPNTQIFVRADRHKIFQVLLNLTANAIHYAQRDNPSIIVRTNIITKLVVISVEDNGMGIKSENLSRIFERFYRVESSRTRREGGSGLGLAIVKHILEAHHQTISAESVYLEGTKFHFTLPAVPGK